MEMPRKHDGFRRGGAKGRGRRAAAAVLPALFVCAGIGVDAARGGVLPTARAPRVRGRRRFEVVAWVDHFDYVRAAPPGEKPRFDTETLQGCDAILDYVRRTGATTILWRNCGGGVMRYASRVESHHHDSVPDKRRVPDSRPEYGWVRYGAVRPDLLRAVLDACRKRGLQAGVHWPFEETHWAGWTIGRFNLEHPQYWARTPDGTPWWGRCSLGWPEVLRHKLALGAELADRGARVVFIDFFRTGAWGPLYAYTPPVVRAYREKHGAPPPSDPNDMRWRRHVGAYVTHFLRELRETLRARDPSIALWVGIPCILPEARNTWKGVFRWREWARAGLIDALVINYVCWDGKHPFASTRALCRQVMKEVGPGIPVYWPVRAYNYGGFGMPDYMKAAGLSQEEVARRLTRMAWEEGAAGISLECVDYRNYTDATCRVLRDLTAEPCRFRQPVGPRSTGRSARSRPDRENR